MDKAKCIWILLRCLKEDSHHIPRQREGVNHLAKEKTKLPKGLKVELERALNMMETSFPVIYLMISQENATEELLTR